MKSVGNALLWVTLLTICAPVQAQIPPSALHVTIANQDGAPINARLEVLLPDYKSGKVERVDSSHFIAQIPQDVPYALEACARQYQARVILPEEVRQCNDSALTIRLNKGPFAYGTSVWEAVTGRPPTEEAVAAVPLARTIRAKEWSYYSEAFASSQPEPEHAAPPPRTPKDRIIRVVDTAGQPVTGVVFHIPQQEQYLNAQQLPPPDALVQSLAAPDGVYTISTANGCWLSALGLARAVAARDYYARDAKETIVLTPSCSVEFQIRNATGQPMADVPVCTSDAAWTEDGSRYCLIMRSDAQGGARLDGETMGSRSFSIGDYGRNMQRVSVSLAPGSSAKVMVTLTERQGSTDPLVLMQTLREKATQSQSSEVSPEFLDKETRSLSVADRARLAATVRQTLEVGFPDSEDRWRAGRELQFLLSLARLLEDKDTGRVLRPLFIEVAKREGRQDWVPDEQAMDLASAIAALEKDRAVPFLVKCVGDAKGNREARLAALVALGQIPSKKAVKAFVRLRDAAYGKKGAPKRLSAYTHRERMIEATVMTLLVIPGALSSKNPPSQEPDRFMVDVNEDYLTGTVIYAGTRLELRRTGAEWIVSSATERRPMP